MYIVTIQLGCGWKLVKSHATYGRALAGLADRIRAVDAECAVISLPDGTDEYYDRDGELVLAVMPAELEPVVA